MADISETFDEIITAYKMNHLNSENLEERKATVSEFNVTDNPHNEDYANFCCKNCQNEYLMIKKIIEKKDMINHLYSLHSKELQNKPTN